MHAPSVSALERSRVRRLGVALLAMLLLSASATPAFAAEIRQGDSIVVGPNETIDYDLYAFGSSVTILGTVNGDVFTAGSNITTRGTVKR
jgi:hypothetical protein